MTNEPTHIGSSDRTHPDPRASHRGRFGFLSAETRGEIYVTTMRVLAEMPSDAHVKSALDDLMLPLPHMDLAEMRQFFMAVHRGLDFELRVLASQIVEAEAAHARCGSSHPCA